MFDNAMSDQINRRTFLERAAAGGLTLSMAPSLQTVHGADAPTEKIIVGIIGTGGRGTSLSESYAQISGAEVAYVCDVDKQRVQKAQATVENHQDRSPEAVGDFRRILDDDAVDAVVIATPDHWHAPAAILALSAGKHVYVEKPCSHNAREGELLVEVANEHQRVVQMGNQRRSWDKVVEGIHKVKTGRIGDVHFSRGWYANTRGSIGHGTKTSPPSHLDFELWQGPAPRREYQDNLLHYNWHWFWNWGTGEAGNNGVHALDLCRWGLDVDYPVRVSSSGGRYHWDDDWQTPDTHTITFDFPGEKSATWEGRSCNGLGHHGAGFGVSFHGTDGSVVITGNGYTIYDLDNNRVSEAFRGDFDIDVDHIRNFLDAIRGSAEPNAPIEGGHKSTLLCHLGNIAHRTGRTLHCDSSNGHIRDDQEAQEYWDREYHPKWKPQTWSAG